MSKIYKGTYYPPSRYDAEGIAHNPAGDNLLQEMGIEVIPGGQQGPEVPGDLDLRTIVPFWIDHRRAGGGDRFERHPSPLVGYNRACAEGAPCGRKFLWWLLNNGGPPQHWECEYREAPRTIIFMGDIDLRKDGELCWLQATYLFSGGVMCWIVSSWNLFHACEAVSVPRLKPDPLTLQSIQALRELGRGYGY